jgi:poly(A) polymerase
VYTALVSSTLSIPHTWTNHCIGSDIDTLIVGPKHVTRDDFLDHFPTVLEKLSPANAIEDIKVVRDAYVPIIKLMYSGIDLDLIYCRLQVNSISMELDLKETSLLRGLDDADLRSINGTRVTDEILTLVPQIKPFRHALRAIKLWAQRRAVYANIVGFPGGVAWAMLVARICQLYPMACGATIVTKFFHLIGNWRWPTPVLLKSIEEGPLQVRIWNPQIYPSDKRHLMPIITPAYPSMCATHNITHSTKAIILKEVQRGNEIANNIASGKSTWKDLFVKHNFFTKDYKYYLSIVSAGRTKKAQKEWSGLVESKVRRLVSGIEMSDTGVQCAHPFTKGFERIHLCKAESEIDRVFQGSIDFQITDEKAAEIEAAKAKEETPQDVSTGTLIYTNTFYIGLQLGEGDGKFYSKSVD